MPKDELVMCGNQKINISAYRVLCLLQLLVESDGVTFEELAQRLAQDPYIQKELHEETIGNYLQTLKRCGYKWGRPQASNRYTYRLKNPTLPVRFSHTDALVMRFLLSKLALLPRMHDRQVAYEMLMFWLSLTDRFSPPAVSPIASPEPPWKPPAKKLTVRTSSGPTTLVEELVEYCRQELVITVQMEPEDNSPTGQKYVLEPYQVIDSMQGPCLLGLDTAQENLLRLPVSAIVSIHQENGKCRKRVPAITVQFRLTDRLAKSYRLYPLEVVVATQEGFILVEAKTVDLEALLNRLLKYHVQCEVLSPFYVREAMRQKIIRLRSRVTDGSRDEIKDERV